MAPGSTKDVVKAVHGYLQTSTLPLPDDLLELLQSYIDKHSPLDDHDAQRIHEELLVIYQKEVVEHPNRVAGFIAVLRQLKPTLEGYKRLIQWWDVLATQVVEHMGCERGLAAETRFLLLDIMIYDTDGEEKRKDSEATSSTLTCRLLEMWLSKAATPELDAAGLFLQSQIRTIILDFGRKRQKDLFTSMDKYFLQKKFRSHILALLGEFIRTNPPHLYLLLQTPLWTSLLKCLETDTSTTVISLAMTDLVMLLPHIPNSSVRYLPTLFKIYSRLLFWERERGSSSTERLVTDVNSQPGDSDSDDDDAWEKLAYSSDFDGEMVPEILNYFTFLYGLYPINFMSYIRKPERYLRHANYDDSDDMDVQPSEVRERSEPFRAVHLLHPNFFSLTIKSEVNNPNRWMKSEAADVTAACMAFFSGPPAYVGLAGASELRETGPAPLATHRLEALAAGSDAETASIHDTSIPILDVSNDATIEEERNSWRNTAITMVAPSHEEENETSGAKLDDPCLPQESIVGSLDVKDVVDTHDQILAYMQSIARFPSPKAGVEESLSISLLHREIMLLKNDLNFERYLKQQHLSHISQLRTKHVRQATVEAETQNLLSTNRGLKASLLEAKNTTAQIRRESEKSRTHAKKWEAELTSKLRVLKEEQKRWSLEIENLNRELTTARDNNKEMRLMIVNTERRELQSLQALQSMESGHEDSGYLKEQIEKLKSAVRLYEAKEVQHEETTTKLAVVEGKLHTMEMQMDAQDAEALRVQAQKDKQIEELRVQHDSAKETAGRASNTNFQVMIDNALSTLQTRLAETQRAHVQLQKRYVDLEAKHADLQINQKSEAVDYMTSRPRQVSQDGISAPTTPTTPGAYGTGMGFPRSRAAVLPTSAAQKQQIFATPPGSRSGSVDRETPTANLSGIRGRGGVQGGKRKEKKDEHKDKDKEGPRFPGLRGIRGFVS